MKVVELLHIPVRLLYLAVLIYHTVEGHTEHHSGSSGQLVSLSYPNDYSNSNTCTFYINSDGTAVTVTFVDFLTETCCDHVKVYDADDNLLETLSGSQSGHQVARAGDKFKLVHTTDGGTVYRGFKVTWTAFVCSYTFTGSSGSLTSPYYPNNYVDGLSCTYTITSDVAIILTFQEIETENGPDYVKVSDKYSVVEEHLRGSQIDVTVRHAANYYRLEFITDTNVVKKGFRATWTAYDCNADLNGSSGSVTSPYYPNDYVDGLSCTWTIEGGSTLISLKFGNFSTEMDNDFVKVYDKNNTLLATLTGEVNWFVVKSTTYYKLTFTTDGSNVRRGFSASWTVAPSSLPPSTFIFTHGACIQERFYITPTTGLSLRCLEKFTATKAMECLQKCLLIEVCTAFDYVDNICGQYENGMGGNTIGSEIWKRD